MGRGTLGNPRVKESKAARQARLLRALEHRVRRLEKQVRPAVTNVSGPLLNVEEMLGEQTLMPSHSYPSPVTGRLPFTLVDPEEAFERHEELMRGVLDRMDLRPSQEALNRALSSGIGAVEVRYAWIDDIYKQPRWWTRLFRFFQGLSRRALGAMTPPYGVREAGPTLSDDTQ